MAASRVQKDLGEMDAEELREVVAEIGQFTRGLCKAIVGLVLCGYVYLFRSEIASFLVRLGAEVE